MLNQKNQSSEVMLSANLRRLVLVRLLAVIGEAAVIGTAVSGLGMPLPLVPLLSIVLIHLVFNLFTWWRLHSAETVSAFEFFIQLSVDVLVLLALLYFAGGATNPFVSLLVLPLVIAAAVLPRAYVWAMAVLVVSGYGGLMFVFRAMPHVSAHVGADFDWHVIGMWFGFLLAVAVIVFFVLRMAESLRERDRVLAEARERALRDEQLVALGTLAAGAAHELGTPLSTMAVLSKDMEQEYAADESLSKRLGILRQQVDRCKETLAMISVSAGQTKADSGGCLPLDEFLQEIVDDWHARQPQAVLSVDIKGEQPAPMIVSEKGLSQAIITFLDNAADSSPDDVEMNGEWSEHQLNLRIADRGQGMSPELKARIGRVPFTTKPEGHGLGLLLASAIIQRLGGTLEVLERDGGGSCVQVVLSLDKLLVNDD